MSLFFKAYCRIYQKATAAAAVFLDWREPELITGAGSVKKLPEAVRKKNLNNALVVTDKGLMELNLLGGLFEELDKQEIKYTVYDGVQQNPTINNVEEAAGLYTENGCDCIIAFGGGSPMDCAKLCGARIARPGRTVPQMRGLLKISKKLPPLFAVPTTAGTGSETTIAAVVSNPVTHEKNAVTDPVLRPALAVLDAELTVGLPKSITAATGMDALTHAVEAYIGRSNTRGTKKAAEKAAKLIFDNLPAAYEDGKNIDARTKMLEASYFAGIAFTRAYVGYVHAIAHNLGGMYGTPHGLANAVILPYVLDFYGKSAYRKLSKLADTVGLETLGMTKAQKAELFIAKIREMNRMMNIPEKFDMIKTEDIPLLAKRALKEGNPHYPVPKIMNTAECEALIKQLTA